MTRPEDLTPPPAERLPERRKQEMRQRLIAATTPTEGPARSSWLMPALAAAAVVAIVGVGAAVVQHDGDTGDSGATGLQPAGSGGPVATSPSATTTTNAPAPHTTVPPTAPNGQAGDATTCAQEIDNLAEPDLAGATVTADRDYGAGVTSLFETKTAWIVCDTWAAVDGGAPTLFASHMKAEGYQPSTQTLAISMNFSLDDPAAAEYVAGGRDFDGVQSIAYTFPDGHTEPAVAGETGLWSMVYLPSSGPLADPQLNVQELDPIEVLVTLTSGDTASYTLQWGLDTCAQINHGC